MIDHLLLINGQHYYLDIDAISEYIKMDPVVVESYKKGLKGNNNHMNPDTMINVTKYEIVNKMMDVFFNMGFSMQDTADMDDTEKLIKGVNEDSFDDMPVPFKIAFNTLIINKIITNHEPTSRKNKRGDSEIKK